MGFSWHFPAAIHDFSPPSTGSAIPEEIDYRKKLVPVFSLLEDLGIRFKGPFAPAPLFF